MREVMIAGGAAALVGGAAWWWRVQRLRALARERLNQDVDVPAPAAEGVELAPSLRRWRWFAALTAVLAVLVLSAWAGLPLVYAVAAGAVVGVATWLVEGWWHARNALRLESQLADAIDLMVAALSAGAGVTDALEGAAREAARPLQAELKQLLGRIRYGESPKRVFEEFGQRVPMETFRLFSFTLAVHGEVGGSLAPTLSTVGRSIRDRIETDRRIKSQATQAQASVIGIVAITWFLGLLMWRANPANFEEFVAHPVGGNFIAGAIVLQAVGLMWITRMAKLRF